MTIEEKLAATERLLANALDRCLQLQKDKNMLQHECDGYIDEIIKLREDVDNALEKTHANPPGHRL